MPEIRDGRVQYLKDGVITEGMFAVVKSEGRMYMPLRIRRREAVGSALHVTSGSSGPSQRSCRVSFR